MSDRINGCWCDLTEKQIKEQGLGSPPGCPYCSPDDLERDELSTQLPGGQTIIITLLRLLMRVCSLLARVAADETANPVYRSQAQQCVHQMQGIADWVYTGALGKAPSPWLPIEHTPTRKRAKARQDTYAADSVTTFVPKEKRTKVVHDYLLANQPATVADISDSLGIYRTNVYYYLKLLNTQIIDYQGKRGAARYGLPNQTVAASA